MFMLVRVTNIVVNQYPQYPRIVSGHLPEFLPPLNKDNLLALLSKSGAPRLCFYLSWKAEWMVNESTNKRSNVGQGGALSNVGNRIGTQSVTTCNFLVQKLELCGSSSHLSSLYSKHHVYNG